MAAIGESEIAGCWAAVKSPNISRTPDPNSMSTTISSRQPRCPAKAGIERGEYARQPAG